MERRRTGSLGLPPAEAATLAASEALQLCAALRAAAADTPTCRRDCRTLSRFVGKVMLVLEALQPAMTQAVLLGAAARVAGAAGVAHASSGGLAAAWSAAVVESRHQAQVQQQLPSNQEVPNQQACDEAAAAGGLYGAALIAAWAEAAADVREALAAAAELVELCRAMGRLQAVMEAEEMRDRFSAAARDLGLALSGLQALQGVGPADMAEDVVTVQRQLAAVRFSSAAAQEQLAARMLQAVVLHHLRQCEGGDVVAPLVAEGLALAGLEGRGQAWLDFEVARLRDAAARAAAQGDPITEFFYKQVLMCLLAYQFGAWGAPQQQQQQPALQHEASNGSSAAGVGTPPVAASTPHKSTSDSSSLLLGDELAPEGPAAAAAAAGPPASEQQQQG